MAPFEPSFDDLLAAVMLYLGAWELPSDEDGVTSAFRLLQEQVSGADAFTSHERERIFRDAAIRVAAERGEKHASIAWRYGLTASQISRIALAGGMRRRGIA